MNTARRLGDRAWARHPRRAWCVRAGFAVAAWVAPWAAHGQATISPRNTTPAAWERFAVRVVNQTDTATVAVHIDVPDAVTILGVQPVPRWSVRQVAATVSAPQSIEWHGGELRRGEFHEFVFLGRLAGDARQTELVFPVRLTRSDGSIVEDRGLRVAIEGRTRLSVRGVTAVAGTALGVALIALMVAVSARQRRIGSN